MSKEEKGRIPESQVITGVERLVRLFPATASIFLGLSGLAYIIGWFTAKAYFSEFGAEWMLSEISTLSLLGHSWIPIAGVAFFAYSGISDLANSHEEKFNSARIRKWMNVFILITFSTIIASHFRIRFQSELSYISALIAVVLAGATIEIAVLHLGTPRLDRDISLMHLAGGVLIFCVYLVPTQIGRARAIQDLDPSKSELAVVLQAPQEVSNMRLLLSSGDRLYVVELGESSPRIKILPASTIHSIQRAKRQGT